MQIVGFKSSLKALVCLKHLYCISYRFASLKKLQRKYLVNVVMLCILCVLDYLNVMSSTKGRFFSLQTGRWRYCTKCSLTQKEEEYHDTLIKHEIAGNASGLCVLKEDVRDF